MSRRQRIGFTPAQRLEAEDPELFAALREKKSRDTSVLPIEDKSRCRCMGTCAHSALCVHGLRDHGCGKPIEGDKRAVMERLLADWEATPGLRLGQFLSNAVEYAKTERHAPDLFYIEDAELVNAVRKYRRK